MFDAEGKKQIEKFQSIQVQGSDGKVIKAGKLYIKYTIQWLASEDSDSRAHIGVKMEEMKALIEPRYVSHDEIVRLNILLRDILLVGYSLQKVNENIAAIARKASNKKRGKTTVAA
jgi:hypothetical protein